MIVRGFLRREPWRSRTVAWLADRRGGAAVEFAILSPLLALIFAGLIDLGSVIFVKYRLDTAVSTGANYAIVRSESVNASDGVGLATVIAAILTDGGGTSANATVVVNGGSKVKVNNGGFTTSGTAAAANSCYCPTVSSSVTWGDAFACGAACPSGGFAGKFVEITATRGHVALFSNYTMVQNGTIAARAMVQTE